MRENCTSCARKHLSQALVLAMEVFKGYPAHAWVAVGHLAEAEDELVPNYLDIATEIRKHRVQYMLSITSKASTLYTVPFMDLIGMLNDTDPDNITVDLPEDDDGDRGAYDEKNE